MFLPYLIQDLKAVAMIGLADKAGHRVVRPAWRDGRIETTFPG